MTVLLGSRKAYAIRRLISRSSVKRHQTAFHLHKKAHPLSRLRLDLDLRSKKPKAFTVAVLANNVVIYLLVHPGWLIITIRLAWVNRITNRVAVWWNVNPIHTCRRNRNNRRQCYPRLFVILTIAMFTLVVRIIADHSRDRDKTRMRTDGGRTDGLECKIGVAFFATGPGLGLIMYILTTLEFPKHNQYV